MKTDLSRRKFLQTAGAATAAGAIQGAPSILSAQTRGDRLRVAFVGVGGISGSHINMALGAGDVAACYCDVDSGRMGNIENAVKRLEGEGKGDLAKIWKQGKRYQDFREMFEKEEDNFDAVMVGIPDHSHYPATVLAMNAGKAVYTQKPLTHTVWEARQLSDAVDRFKLATQMGNQGHANEGNRLIAAYIQGGYLGDITEIHCFTNRPIWPQGMPRPGGEDSVPDTLDWESWIGCAPMRPYVKGAYHDFKWRGVLDFGGGALADMACHTMDSIFMSLDPGYPTHVEALNVDTLTDDAFPKGSTLKWTFGPNGDRPGFDVYWYDGTDNEYTDSDGNKRRHPRLEELAEGAELATSGNIYVGTKNKLLVTGDYGDSCRIIPEEARLALAKEIKDATGDHRPPRVYEKSIGHYEEWHEAALGNQPYDYPGSNFKYAGPFTETIQLGNVCLYHPGEKLAWDGPNLRFTNSDEANKRLTKPYRDGWDFKLKA